MLDIKKHIQKILLIVAFVSALNEHSSNAQEDSSLVNKVAQFADGLIDRLTIDRENYSLVVYPALGYSKRTGLFFGIMPVLNLKSDDNDSIVKDVTTLTPRFFVSNTGMVDVGVEMIAQKNAKWLLNCDVQYQYLNDLFYGYGNANSKEILSDFKLNTFGLESSLVRKIGGAWFGGLKVELLKSGIQFNTELYDDMDRDVWDLALGPVVSYDSRDNVIYPQKGYFISGSLIGNNTFLNSRKFWLYQFDARKYFDLGGKDAVLGVQLFSESATGDIPFYKLPALGGSQRVRGIAHKNMYLDNKLWFAQCEYRTYLFWRIGMAAFTGMGNVYGNFSTNKMFEDVHLFAGAGFRFRVLEDENLNFRLDYGMAARGNRAFFFTIREAF